MVNNSCILLYRIKPNGTVMSFSLVNGDLLEFDDL